MTAVTRNTEYDVVAVCGRAAGGMAETTWLDATAQADLVRRGEVSPKELAEAAIARIEAVNPQLDAVIRTRFDAARLEADGDLPDGPFRGVTAPPGTYELVKVRLAAGPRPGVVTRYLAMVLANDRASTATYPRDEQAPGPAPARCGLRLRSWLPRQRAELMVSSSGQRPGRSVSPFGAAAWLRVAP